MEVQVLSPETIQDTLPPANSTATVISGDAIDSTFAASTNLTTTVLNSSILSNSDEFFAEAVNLLNPGPVKGYPGVFIATGAKYDGWETRRHNPAEYDWVVIKLGCVGIIEGIEVDTAFFTGNYGEYAALDACYSPDASKDSEIAAANFPGWDVVLPPQPCGPSQRQAWKPASSGNHYTHVRLRMYPDGGFSRLRLYGQVVPPPAPSTISSTSSEQLEDLASALNGGVATACSDQHFGVRSNLLLPGRGKDMGDGWETKRSRAKGHVDWVTIRLGLPAKSIEKVVVDTKDFKGNFPRLFKVEGLLSDPSSPRAEEPKADDGSWTDLIIGEQPGKAHTELVYEGSQLAQKEVGEESKVWTHVKLTMIPDGGVKRIRVFGHRA